MANKTWIYNAYLAQNAFDRIDIQNSENVKDEKTVVEPKTQEVTEEKPQIQQKPIVVASVFQNYGSMKI